MFDKILYKIKSVILLRIKDEFGRTRLKERVADLKDDLNNRIEKDYKAMIEIEKTQSQLTEVKKSINEEVDEFSSLKKDLDKVL